MKWRLARFFGLSSFVGYLTVGCASMTADGGLTAAPAAAKADESIVRVYGARTLGAKGVFGVHTWIAARPAGESQWTVYEVVGWRLRWTDTAVVVRNRAPDTWFGSQGEIYAEKRGAGVDDLIKRIDQAAREYPYAGTYTLWPGPNSNTFTAWIGRAVPELQIDLPATAIGKDYIGSSIFSRAPSGSGVQLSLWGVLGFAASGIEGVELNLLSLNFGVSPSGIKLPLIGRIGSPRFASEAPAREPAN